jgi:hypothetical protein
LKGFFLSKVDLFFAAEWRKSGSEGGEGFSRGIVYVSLHQVMLMIELLEPALAENILEAVGNKTEAWSDRWWWKPLRYLTLVGPFIAVGVYYHWFF